MKSGSAINEPISALALTLLDMREPIHVVPGLIAEGVTVLGGAPKVGKSFLALGLAISLASGHKVLDKIDAGQKAVLYLCLEGTLRDLRNRILNLSHEGADLTQLLIATEWPVGAEGVKKLEKWLGENPEVKFVIIDTLQAFRGPSRSSGNNYERDYNDLQPISQLAYGCDVDILILHHLKKGGDHSDDFDALSGSTAIRGAVDNQAIMIPSGDGGVALRTEGRDLERVEVKLVRAEGSLGWTLSELPPGIRDSQVEKLIIGAMKSLGLSSVSPLEVAIELDRMGEEYNPDSVRTTLSRLARRDNTGIVRTKRGQYGFEATVQQ